MSNPSKIPRTGSEDAEASGSGRSSVSTGPPLLSRQDTLQSQSSTTSSTVSTAELAAKMPINFSASDLLKQGAAAVNPNPGEPLDANNIYSMLPIPPQWSPPRFHKMKEWRSNGTTSVQIFHPTIGEMKNFSKYIEKIEREQGPHLTCGICKIIPPEEWSATLLRFYDCNAVDKIIIKDPVKETSKKDPNLPKGVYRKENTIVKEMKEIPAKKFRELATSPAYDAPKRITTMEALEKYYWKNTFKNEPIYGADTPGTLFDKPIDIFNITRLKTMLDLVEENAGKKIPGVNTPYLYFGMYKTTFPWHVEDMDLYSINYVHIGEPKFWYAIPPEAADRFERLAAQFFPEDAGKCQGFLRHKMYQVSPEVLRQHGIPFGTMVQYPGEFIITFPRGFHMGFNCGFNVAEATNFAIDRWIDYGKNVPHMCKCTKDHVEIDMIPYMTEYRSAEKDDWYHYWYDLRSQAPKEIYSKGITQSQLDNLYKNVPQEEQFAAVIASRQAYHAMKKKQVLEHVFSLKGSLHYDKLYNASQGKIFPNCAVCQYLVPDLNLYTEARTDYQMPAQTRRYVNNQMFTKNAVCETPDPTIDDLLTCDNCSVTVHRHCYTVIPFDDGCTAETFPEVDEDGQFLCYRCRNRSKDQIEHTVCHFCPMRGGALIPAVHGMHNVELFAHVICSMASRRSKILAIPEERTPFSLTLASGKLYGKNLIPRLVERLNPFKLRFEDEFAKEDLKGDPDKPKEKEMEPEKPPETPRSDQCDLCAGMGEDMITCRLCPDKEPRHMHATCARLLEVIFEARIYPKVIVPICSIHTCEAPNYIIKDVTFDKGDKVRVFDIEKNARDGVIVEIQKSEMRHTVNFLDDSVCSEVAADEIIRCECNELLCDKVNHIYGSLVCVKWENGNTYEGYYRGSHRDEIAKVAIDGPQHSPTKVTRRSLNQEQVVQYDITPYQDIAVSTKLLRKTTPSPHGLESPKKPTQAGRGRGRCRGRGRKRRSGQ